MIGITGLQSIFLDTSHSPLGKILLGFTLLLGVLVITSFLTTRLLKKLLD